MQPISPVPGELDGPPPDPQPASPEGSPQPAAPTPDVRPDGTPTQSPGAAAAADPCAAFDALIAEAARILATHTPDHPDRKLAAHAVHLLLSQAIHGRNALSLAAAEALLVMNEGKRLDRVRPGRLWDYARQRLGRGRRAIQADLKLAATLHGLPVLREMVIGAWISPRKAQVVAPALEAARDQDDRGAEALWLWRAVHTRVCELQDMVASWKAARKSAQAPAKPKPEGYRFGADDLPLDLEPPEPLGQLFLNMDVRQQAAMDMAMTLAPYALGHGAGPILRLQAIAEEYLGVYGLCEEDQEAVRVHRTHFGPLPAEPGLSDFQAPAAANLDTEALTRPESGHWRPDGSPLPGPDADDRLRRPYLPLDLGLPGGDFPDVEALRAMSPFDLDRRVRAIARLASWWEEAYGRLARLAFRHAVWARERARGHGDYCHSQLGVHPKVLRRHIRLDERMDRLPQLREAFRSGLLRYSQASRIAGEATPETVEALILEAATTPPSKRGGGKVVPIGRGRKGGSAASADGEAGGEGTQSAPGAGDGEGTQGAPGAGGGEGTQGAPGAGGGEGTQSAPGAGGAEGTQGAPEAGGGEGTQGAPGAGGAEGTQRAPEAGAGEGTQGAPKAGGAEGTQRAPGAGGGEGTQGAQPWRELVATEWVQSLVNDAILAARVRARRAGEGWITPAEGWARVCGHFVDVWHAYVLRIARKSRRDAFAENEGTCATPGCSRNFAHQHHMEYRSHGGPNDAWNLRPICVPCHQAAVHRGTMRVRGRAGGVVVWELGLENGHPTEVWRVDGTGPPRLVYQAA